MRNPNFAHVLTHAQNSGPPLHKILDPPLFSVRASEVLALMFAGPEALALTFAGPQQGAITVLTSYLMPNTWCGRWVCSHW